MNTFSQTLAPGTLVRVRQRNYIIQDLVPAAHGASALLKLAPRSDEPRTFAAYLHALRWACVTSTEPTQERNIEAGVLLDHPKLAESLAGQFGALKESGRLKRMG